jgi:hypothetical protein
MTIQIENVDEATRRRLEVEVRRRGRTVSAIVLELIERQYPPPSASEAGPPFRDLNDLAGAWSEEDRREFDANTAQFRQVDEQLWR